MSKDHQVHYKALELAVSGNDVPAEGDPKTQEYRAKMIKASLSLVSAVRKAALSANDAELLAACDHAQKQIEGKPPPDREPPG
jgi:hypothetical protein